MMTDKELLRNKYKTLNKAELLRLQHIAVELYGALLEFTNDSVVDTDAEGNIYWTQSGETL